MAVVIIFLISAFTSSVVWSVKDRTHSAQVSLEITSRQSTPVQFRM